MKHAREDYNRFQDPDGLIPEDEPVFLIRGQDIVAPQVLHYWAIMAKSAGASDEIVTLVHKHADLMEAWQATVARKIPDL